ncbi:hypothetical protein [Streptomyces sp. NBC_00057]|uniref:hypothetical protein n=1 Tax=Streptomyces sp. NBC_00057 TaxID=2975634 RepID=UPI00325344B7
MRRPRGGGSAGPGGSACLRDRGERANGGQVGVQVGSVKSYGEGADPVLVIPAAFMTDAKNDATSSYSTGYSSAVEQKLTKAGRGWKLIVTPDAMWPAAPEQQYPVTIDPTIAIAPTPTTAQDVMISSDGPRTNYDDNWRLQRQRDHG